MGKDTLQRNTHLKKQFERQALNYNPYQDHQKTEVPL